VILTPGARGDVAWFAGLGQRLQQAGHQVAVAAHEPFAGLVRGCGLEYRLLPGDPHEFVRDSMRAPSAEMTRAAAAAFLD
jgi:sterol 3beta-glucosyltransferase